MAMIKHEEVDESSQNENTLCEDLLRHLFAHEEVGNGRRETLTLILIA